MGLGISCLFYSESKQKSMSCVGLSKKKVQTDCRGAVRTAMVGHGDVRFRAKSCWSLAHVVACEFLYRPVHMVKPAKNGALRLTNIPDGNTIIASLVMCLGRVM